MSTALYYGPHLAAMPDRAGAALSAIVSAPPGGVLFHCIGGRDRTGMIAMLLLCAAQTESEEIVEDYLETVRLGGTRAARAGRIDDEADLEALCQGQGTSTSTEVAFRSALASLHFEALLGAAGLPAADRSALASWRGTIPAQRKKD